MFKKILIIILFSFIVGCHLFEPSLYTNIEKSNQQFILRDCIDNCKMFDCRLLNKEIRILKIMIKNNDINAGIQQSIVTTITKKCNGAIIGNCDCFNKENKKIKEMY